MARRLSRILALLFLLPLATRSDAQTARDAFGDPLPNGAITRIGTIRFRHSDTVHALAYSTDGKRITSAAGNAIAVWEAHTGRLLSKISLPSQRLTSATVSADGTLTAYAIDDVVRIVDSANGEVRCALPKHEERIQRLAFSKDGRRLATSDFRSTVFLWNTDTGNLVRKWQALETTGDRGHQAFTPDGKLLVHAAECGVIVIWDVETGNELSRIQPRKEKFGHLELAISPDSETLAVRCGSGSRMDLWQIKSGRFLREISAYGSGGLTFSLDGNYLIWGNFKEICLWDMGKQEISRRIPTQGGYFNCLAVSPHSKILASGGSDHAIRLWDLTTEKEKLPSARSEGICSAVRFLSDGNSVVSIAHTGFFFHDLQGKLLREMPCPDRDADKSDFDISPDGRWILVGNQQKRWIRICDADTGKVVDSLSNLPAQPYFWRFAFHGKFLISMLSEGVLGSDSFDGFYVWKRTSDTTHEKSVAYKASFRYFDAPDSPFIGVWSSGAWDIHHIETGKRIRTLTKHVATISAVSPTGRALLLTRNFKKPPMIWESATGDPLCTLECEPRHMNGLRYAFSRDGRTVAAGLQGTIHLWDALTGKLVATLPGHHGGIHSLQFSPDGRHMLSSGRDTTTLIWDYRKIRPLPPPRDDFTPDILNTLWHQLQSDDAARGYDAIALLVSAPGQTVGLLRQKLKPATVDDVRPIQALIDDLDHANFQIRAQAAAKLVKIVEPAEPILIRALTKPISLECKRRIADILDKMPDEPVSPSWLRTLRALDTLEMIGSADARSLVVELSRGFPEARQTQEAGHTLQRMDRIRK